MPCAALASEIREHGATRPERTAADIAAVGWHLFAPEASLVVTCAAQGILVAKRGPDGRGRIRDDFAWTASSPTISAMIRKLTYDRAHRLADACPGRTAPSR